ncbi:MAG: tyrosine-protein kinase family protein [Eubacteriales bacterium]
MLNKKKKMTVGYWDVLVADSSNFVAVEAFKTIRTNLLYSAKGEKCPVFAVTSSFAHSGKSIVFANLAISFAKLGKKVLLIDLDMRCPVQHKIFHTDNRYGASEWLAGIPSENGTVYRQSEYENLFFMTAGRIPPNPSELLSSDTLKIGLNGFKRDFDYIFLDLPPIGVVSDALVVNEQVTGYVYTVRAEFDNKIAVRDGLETMKKGGARVLGIVLNDVSPESDRHYGKNYQNDRYGYGYGSQVEHNRRESDG